MPNNQKQARRGRPQRLLTAEDKEFCRLIGEVGYGSITAARRAYGWRCKEGTIEYNRAKDLPRRNLFKKEIERVKAEDSRKAEAETIIDGRDLDEDALRRFAYERLKELRDDDDTPPASKFKVIEALQKLHDPSQDTNLIWRYIDVAQKGLEAHCPACHSNFPLAKVELPYLKEYRLDNGEPANITPITDLLDRRLELIKLAEKRARPHAGQLKALKAVERNVIGLGAARAGKCSSAEDLIPLADGRMVTYGSLIGKWEEILAYGPVGEQIKQRAYFSDNGLKEVFEVTTKSGRKITRTGNHPLLATSMTRGHGKRSQISSIGWKEIQHINVGEFVQVPKKLNVEGIHSRDLNEIKLCGYLLGDGGVTQGVSFAQKDGRVLEEFKSLVDFYDCKWDKNGDCNYKVYGKTGTTNNHILNLVKNWGMYRKKAKEKYLPDWVWTLPNDQLAVLINRIFACDGWASKKEVCITLASERLIWDLHYILLRFGVSTTIMPREASYTNQGVTKRGFKAWTLRLESKSIPIFCKKIGIFGKENQLNEVLTKVESSPYQTWKESGCPEGYFWDEIVSITPLGSRPTVNVSVPNYHTYLTNFVEHNSYLLGLFCVLYAMIPGSEVWLIARTYDAARSEREYLESFIKTIFYPNSNHMVQTYYDAKSGEWTMKTGWGSEVKIISAGSKGSITGRELDACLIAEPGWVQDNIYNHIRARLSSRLGRIIALGTPQGMGGIISRLVFTTGRDPTTGRIRRLTPEERLIENGAAWNISSLIFKLSPEENPAYVKSELEAARQEMGDEEYASEFEGEMVAHEGMKFHSVRQGHLQKINKATIADCVFILGVDQGPKNFGAVLLAYNGEKVYVIKDYFESDVNTIRTNMEILKKEVPIWIRACGGLPEDWRLTIFDQDPPVHNTLIEMESEAKPWPTDVTFRHDNKKVGGLSEDWRKDTTTFLNEMAKRGNLIFDEEDGAQLHDECMRVENVPPPPGTDGSSGRSKGWKISGSWRQDHILDGLMFGMWTILSKQIDRLKEKTIEPHDTWKEAQLAQAVMRRTQEARELNGYPDAPTETEDEIFESVYGRKRSIGEANEGLFQTPGHYRNY